jgi:hypothetical protein
MGQPIPDFVTPDTRKILERLNQLEDTLAPGPGWTLHWRIGPVTRQQTPPSAQTSAQPTEGTPSMADLELTADQQARLQATGRDDDGNPVDLTGNVTYACDNDTVLTLTDNGDGTALIVTTGPTGSALVTATGTVSGGSVIGSLAVDVTSGEVSSIAISATVEPQGTP